LTKKEIRFTTLLLNVRALVGQSRSLQVMALRTEKVLGVKMEKLMRM